MNHDGGLQRPPFFVYLGLRNREANAICTNHTAPYRPRFIVFHKANNIIDVLLNK